MVYFPKTIAGTEASPGHFVKSRVFNSNIILGIPGHTILIQWIVSGNRRGRIIAWFAIWVSEWDYTFIFGVLHFSDCIVQTSPQKRETVAFDTSRILGRSRRLIAVRSVSISLLLP